MKRRLWRVGMILLVVACGHVGVAAARASDKKPQHTKSGFITTPDGVKIHFLEAGRSGAYASAELGNPLPPGKVPTKGNIAVTDPYKLPSILFIPGWTMPAWIWEKQLAYFSKDYRVVAMDPRSQGESAQTSEGLYPAARARDIKAVVTQLRLAPVVLVGWSMAVNELLSYVGQFGTADIAGLVLVDGDDGSGTPAEKAGILDFLGQLQRDRQKMVREFVPQFFKKPQPDGYVDRVIEASMRVPANTSVARLLGYYSTDNHA